MAANRNWTIHWNEKAGQFFVRYRVFPPPEFGAADPAWGTKRIPKEIRRHQQLDAERWMITWYSQYVGSGGVIVDSPKIVPAAKTLSLLGPRWLKYRYDDPGTKINTYKGLKESLFNWILDNERFEHVAIEKLDMETDFTSDVCLRWMNSISGKDATVLAHTLTLSTCFNECIAMEWLDRDMVNPFERPIMKKAIGKLVESAKQKRVLTHLSEQQEVALLTVPTRKVTDFRRIRYLLGLRKGLRDHEIQGLIFEDFVLDAPIPYVDVQRQLDKIGVMPFLNADALQRQGMSKDEILKLPNALVSPPKRNSKRALPLLPIEVAVIRYWRAVGWKLYVGRAPGKGDPVFPSGKTNRHSPAGQFAFVESPELLRLDLERVGQPTTYKGIALDFHATRRTLATRLSENGVSEGDIGDVLGHGAKSTARGHYISSELLRARLNLLRRLPPLVRVQLMAKVIDAPADERARVFDLPVRARR